MKGRNAKTIRTYQLINILEGAPHGLTVGQMLSRLQDRGFEINKKTVYRDIEGIKAMGVQLLPKGCDDNGAERWAIEKNSKVGHYLMLSAKELIALYFAKGALRPLQESPFYQDLESTFAKIEAQVPHDGRAFLEEISEELHFESGPQWGIGFNPEILEVVRSACTEKHLLKINYSSNNSQTTRDRILGPKFMYFSQGVLYLVAEEIETKTHKTFSFLRINEATMLEEAYDGEEIDPEQYFASSFGVYNTESVESIQLIFHPPLATYIAERQWHKSQRLSKLDDGRVELCLELGVSPELVQWVLGFGHLVEVLSPDSLKQRIIEEAQGILSQYGNK